MRFLILHHHSTAFNWTCFGQSNLIDELLSTVVIIDTCYIGELLMQNYCQISSEFAGVNHETSHDGLIELRSVNIDQDILAEISGIRVWIEGTHIRD